MLICNTSFLTSKCLVYLQNKTTQFHTKSSIVNFSVLLFKQLLLEHTFRSEIQDTSRQGPGILVELYVVIVFLCGELITCSKFDKYSLRGECWSYFKGELSQEGTYPLWHEWYGVLEVVGEGR